MRVMKTDDHGEGPFVFTFQERDGLVDEISRLHRLGGQSRRADVRVEPLARRITKRPSVPTADAKSLVAYLLSLKKGYHLKPDEAGIPYVPPATKS